MARIMTIFGSNYQILAGIICKKLVAYFRRNTVFVIIGNFKVNPEDYKPFVPPNEGTFLFSITVILSATSVVFFSYIMIWCYRSRSKEIYSLEFWEVWEFAPLYTSLFGKDFLSLNRKVFLNILSLVLTAWFLVMS